MYDFLKGIVKIYKNNAALSSITNGMGVGRAPIEGTSDADYPFIICYMIDNVPTWTFGPTTYERPTVQFTILSDKTESMSEVTQIWSNLVAAYDNATLSMDNYNHILLQRRGTTGPTIYEEDNKEMVQMTVDYECMIEQK